MNGLTLGGTVLVALGIPLGLQGLSSNMITLQLASGVFLILGIISIVIDLSNNEKILKELLKIED